MRWLEGLCKSSEGFLKLLPVTGGSLSSRECRTRSFLRQGHARKQGGSLSADKKERIKKTTARLAKIALCRKQYLITERKDERNNIICPKNTAN